VVATPVRYLIKPRISYLFNATLIKQKKYPPTPALAKAGAAPGTTAGVELLLLSFPRPLASP